MYCDTWTYTQASAIPVRAEPEDLYRRDCSPNGVPITNPLDKSVHKHRPQYS